MRAQKTIRLPRPKELQSNKLEDIQEYFRKLTEELDKAWRLLFQDVTTTGSVTFLLESVRWRIISVGDNLEVQKKISGVWTTMGKWSE